MKCVYKIKCRDPTITEFYIGSSTNFHRRKITHKSDCNSLNSIKYNYKVYKFIRNNGGFNNWEFEIEQKCEELNKYDLEILEQIYKDLLEPQLNSKQVIINKKENCPQCGLEMLKTSIYQHIKKWCKKV